MIDAKRVRPSVTVLLGDPTLPDETKLGGRYGQEDLDNVERMKAAIAELDTYELDAINSHDGLLGRLAADPPDFILNFCDTGFRNNPVHEWHLTGYLEMLGIPYSGAPPSAMAICYDKGLVRALAAAHGVAVPDEAYFESPLAAAEAIDRFPVLIKPNKGDGSVGITKDAVVHDRDQSRRYLAHLAEILPGRAVLVQEYLPGAEYGIGVIGNPDAGFAVLPALEVDFSGLGTGLAPILSFESKVDPSSPYWTEIKFREAGLSGAAAESLGDTARRLFQRFGLRDYGRFDFRTAADGTIKLMEVNPNPAWAWDGKLAMMASFAGLSYAEMLGRIIDTALARVGLSIGK